MFLFSKKNCNFVAKKLRKKYHGDGSSDHFWVWHIIKDGRCMMEDGRWKIL